MKGQKKFFYNNFEKVIESKKRDEDIELVLLLDQAPSDDLMEINLAHEGVNLNLICLVLAKQNHKIPLNIKINHLARATASQALIKGIAADSAEITAKVVARIAKGARAAKTKVIMKMLIASPAARAKPIPALEIEENEVEAGHAASVGRLEDDQLFYLMSRGLSEEQAKKLLIDGFIQDIFDKIQTPRLREPLRKQVASIYSSSEAYWPSREVLDKLEQ